MTDTTLTILQTSLDDTHLALFALRLTEWLVADLNQSKEAVPEFTESRARSLLRGANLIDDPTLNGFIKLMETAVTVRLALYDLLQQSELGSSEEVIALAGMVGAIATIPATAVSWSALALAAFAWKTEYPLYQLDPASPPTPNSPAGNLARRAASFMRQQVQRSATERDKLARKLAYLGTPNAQGASPTNDQAPIAPVPPYYRTPVPVRYPEYAREGLQVNPEELTHPESAPPRAEPLTITHGDLPPQVPEKTITTMPPLRLSPEQFDPKPNPLEGVGESLTIFATAVREQFSGRDNSAMTTTRLRVIIQTYPNGPALYGLQVRVSCKGIKSQVAGTTNRDGKFLCELPVRKSGGPTYDVEITWPRDMGGDTEKKSVTLSADRVEFIVPFYHHYNP